MSSQRRLRSVPDAGGIRAVAYIRVSAVMRRDEAGNFHSPDLQLRAIRDHLERRGLLEVEVVTDLDVSGRTFNRAGIRRVLELAEAGAVDVVAVLDLSRLGRNTSESLATIKQLRSLGVSVLSTVENFDDSPEGQFQLGLFLGMAQLYSDQMSRKWRQLHAYRFEQGLPHGGGVPRGYVRSDSGQLELDPVWAPIVAEAFQRYAQGSSIRALTRWLHDSHGERVSATAVRKMLTSPVYVGRLRLNDDLVQGKHDRIVDDSTWERVQALRREEQHLPPRARGRAWSLAGLAFCDHCQGRLAHHLRVDPKSKERVPRLECSTRNGDKRLCVGIGTPRVADVEAAVLAELRSKISDWQVTERLRVDSRARQAHSKAEAARLRSLLAENEAAQTRLATDHVRDIMPEQAYVGAARELAAAHVDLTRQIDKLTMAVSAYVDPPATSNAYATLVELWQPATVDERARMIRTLVRAVRVRKAATWREPLDERVDVDTTF